MRSGRAEKREREEDILYNSKLVTQLVNMVMVKGKKSKARKIVYGALDALSSDREEAEELLRQAVNNVAPNEEVRSRRVGGATYQVPIPVSPARAEALALRWIVESARNVEGVPMKKQLQRELQSAVREEGNAVEKRERMHRMAEANRAFAHFRW
ncbi:MAG: 30S ribosomal protein S7 [Patescibacteria group bacterium]